jgi:hypothetical protein
LQDSVKQARPDTPISENSLFTGAVHMVVNMDNLQTMTSENLTSKELGIWALSGAIHLSSLIRNKLK